MNKLMHARKLFIKHNQDPIYLIYYTTNKCNMRCKHCFYWEDINAKTDELSIEELDKTTKNMGNLLHLIISGGEPYLRQDIDQVVDVFVKNTKVGLISIPSNGYYTEKIIAKLKTILAKHPNLTVIQNISFDNIGKKHDEIRGVNGSYERATKTISELHLLKKEFSNLSIGAVLTFNKSNQANFKEIVKDIYEQQKPDNIAINLIRGHPREKINLGLDINKYRQAVEYRNSIYKSKGMSGHTNFRFSKITTAARILMNKEIIKTYEEKIFQSYCYAGELQGVLYSNGDVYPCELLSEKLGNVREYGYNFRKLWRDTKKQRVVEWIKDKKCFCTHECFINTNILFNVKNIPKLIKIALRL